MSTTRRRFLQSAAVGGSALLIARFSHAQDILTNDDPVGSALGYHADHTTVDTAKYANKQEGAQCTTCALYQAIDDEYGNCPIFPGKRVHATGWCNSWVPKG